jgi:hypothetical protein
MAWQRDPQTGEWVMVDAMVPDPMTQSTSQAEPDPSMRDPLPSLSGGPEYSNPDLRPLPASTLPERTPEGAPVYPGASMEPARQGDGLGYQNYDPNAYAEWARGVEERGNEVRETAVGCFEVAAGTNTIVSRAPSGYKVN